MKRILYIEGCKDGTVGGSHTCLFSMIANMDRNKYYPIVVFYDDHVIANKFREIKVETHIINKYTPLNFRYIINSAYPRLVRMVPVLIPFQKLINMIWYFLRLALIYARFIKKHNIDIVHLNNSLNSNHEWMLGAILSGVNIISHERGISDKLSRTSRALGNKLDLQICVSKVVSYPLIKQGLEESKIKVVYDGIDMSKIRIENQPGYIKEAYHISEDVPIIGVLGNIKRWKGQETVVRATALLKKTFPGIKCLLVGSVLEGDTFKKRLENIIQELKIEQNIIFTGFQRNPADLINVMDVVIHSSIEPEPFGMVNLEAMYLKKPVIATKMGGPIEIFRDGEDGILVEPADPELLSQKILELLSNPELRIKMGEKAHQTVLRRFNILDTVNHIHNIYNELCRQ